MITTLSHVACRVRDLEASLRFYRDVLGLPESYRLNHASGETMLVALWLGARASSSWSRRPGASRPEPPLGYHHLGVWVDDMPASLAEWRARGLVSEATPIRRRRGLELLDPRPGGQSDRALAEPPESLQTRAIG